MTTKDTNPKDAVGTKKPQFSTVPMNVVQEVGAGMLEGARKYGRHNYRASGVRASVYFDATMRHLTSWWEGEDVDPDSGLSHITKALCSLVVLRDAQMNKMVTDDRPPRVDVPFHREELQAVIDEIFERHPEAKEAHIAGFSQSDLDDLLEEVARNPPPFNLLGGYKP
ncbi:MAG: dATP/dGTP diphosphohydrolase domain-containing protein [Pseudomonadota bacterium]